MPKTAATTERKNGATALEPVSADANHEIAFAEPYVVTVEIEGTAAVLFHRWSNEAVEEKAKAAKGSAAKKSDNLESYIWRTLDGNVGIPGEYLRMAVVGAAKYRQDPRSPRKSAMDLYKAGIVALTDVASLGRDTWDYVDQRRVMIQRNAITRQRPAFLAGWRATFDIQVVLSEYIGSQDLHAAIVNAGRLIGVGDFRPTYGRFQVVRFEINE